MMGNGTDNFGKKKGKLDDMTQILVDRAQAEFLDSEQLMEQNSTLAEDAETTKQPKVLKTALSQDCNDPACFELNGDFYEYPAP